MLVAVNKQAIMCIFETYIQSKGMKFSNSFYRLGSGSIVVFTALTDIK